MSVSLNKLRWQCHRGIKELDFVLSAYLENAYHEASPSEQSLFITLLAIEDDLLISYFFSGGLPANQAMRQFVEKIRIAFVC